jgi:hypothetical protein
MYYTPVNRRQISKRAYQNDKHTHPRGTTYLSQQTQLFLLHYSRQPKISNHDIRIFSRCSEKEVFRLQVAMYDSSTMYIGHSFQDCSDELCSVALIIVAFCAYTIKEFSSSAEVKAEVKIMGSLEVIKREVSAHVVKGRDIGKSKWK